MALRGVWQLQKLVVNYCDWGGSSRGIRYDSVRFFTPVILVPLDHGVSVSFRAILRELVEIRLINVHRCGNWLCRQSILDCGEGCAYERGVYVDTTWNQREWIIDLSYCSLAREFLRRNFISRQGNCRWRISTGIGEEVKGRPFISWFRPSKGYWLVLGYLPH